MPDMTILALIIGGAVVVLAGLIASRRRRARRTKQTSELPTTLYLAGHTQRGAADDASAVRSAVAAAGWAQPRLAVGSGGAKAASVGWAPGADETVQLLPGRLEPVSDAVTEEIRFVRRAGVTRYTLGRSRGAAHGHVQLRVPSTSRLHAYMEFEGGRWRIGGLSRTNGVVVNGAALAEDSAHVLEDGDRIELGEASFVFRQPELRARVPDDVA
jgi:hypothetical protein